MLEENEIIEPPEIREPSENFHVVEFYVHLGSPRPDLQLLELVRDYLAEKAPRVVMGLDIQYRPASDRGDPDLLVGLLWLGEPIDIG